MAAEIQYYDGKFSKDEGNVVYHNLINCEIVKSPVFNNSFRTKFIQADSEDGDKTNYFLRKRKGFTKVPTYNWDAGENNLLEETDQEWLSGVFTDMKVIDGYRYFLSKNREGNKLRVYKQIHTNDYSKCSSSCLSDITEGHIVNITKYKGNDYFPLNDCNHTKMLVTTYVKGKPSVDSDKGVAMINKIYDTYFSYLYENDSRIPANPGDHILTYGEHGAGLVHVVGKNTDTVGNKEVINLSTTREPVVELVGDENIMNNISYKVFRDYGQTFHFVTADGIVHWHYDEGTPSTFEYTFAGNTYYDTNDNTLTPNFYIQSLTNIDQATAFLSTNGFLFLSDRGYNKFLYSASKIVQTNSLYSEIHEYMGQLVLTGLDQLGMFTYDFNTGASQLLDLAKNNGQFGRGSVGIFDDKFFFVRKTKDLYTMQVQFGYGSSKPAVIFSYLNNFLNTDLDMLDRAGNTVDIHFWKGNVYLFINDGTGNSKVLFYNRYYNVWSKRLVANCELHGVYDGIFLGNGVYKQEGITDNGEPITQIITMIFGDQTQSVGKLIPYIKLPLGYNSYFIKGETYVTSSVDNGGWHYDTTYNDFGRTDYASNIMKVQLGPEQLSNYLGVIKNYPIGLEIESRKGVMFEADVTNTASEFKEYKEYSASASSGDEESTFTVSKTGVIQVPLGQIGEVFTFELVAKGESRLEFGGFFIAFSYLDNDFNRVENTLTLGDLTTDSGKTFVEKEVQPLI